MSQVVIVLLFGIALSAGVLMGYFISKIETRQQRLDYEEKVRRALDDAYKAQIKYDKIFHELQAKLSKATAPIDFKRVYDEIRNILPDSTKAKP